MTVERVRAQHGDSDRSPGQQRWRRAGVDPFRRGALTSYDATLHLRLDRAERWPLLAAELDGIARIHTMGLDCGEHRRRQAELDRQRRTGGSGQFRILRIDGSEPAGCLLAREIVRMTLGVLIAQVGGEHVRGDADVEPAATDRVRSDAVAHVGDPQRAAADQVQPHAGAGLDQLLVDQPLPLGADVTRHGDAVESGADQAEVFVTLSQLDQTGKPAAVVGGRVGEDVGVRHHEELA